MNNYAVVARTINDREVVVAEKETVAEATATITSIVSSPTRTTSSFGQTYTMPTTVRTSDHERLFIPHIVSLKIRDQNTGKSVAEEG